ncbi:MAG: PAS domain S-box protein, partial [Proteobacteria bacterium]|nr:PAS domain S-box protein [Pseudomonadota bacterium]
MKLNLRTKLIGSFVIILLLMVVVGLMGTHTSKTIRDRLGNIIEQDLKPANILGDVARMAGFIRANSLLHLFTGSIDDMNRYESEVADWAGKINTDLNTLENIFKDQATLDKLAEFRTAWETYLRVWREQVVPLSRTNRDEEVFPLARKSGAGGMAAREAMYKLGGLHDANVAAANHSLKLADQDSRKSQYILSALILLAIILGLAFGIRQGSIIAGSVNTVSKAAQLVAAGDLDQRVMVKTGDEIESMANSFNTMTFKLKTMVEELQREITERRRAEDRLRESEQWLSTTLRSIGDAVIATDTDGLVTLMNPVAEDLTGWDETETAGKPLEDIFNIINDQTGGQAENPVTRVLREGVVVGLADHTVLIAKDGTKRHIADSGAPIRDEEGEIIGTVMVFRDITECKQAEEELRKHRDHLEELVQDRTEALRESEGKYRNLTESLDELIYRADPKTFLATYVNRAVEKIYGYTVEEWLRDPTIRESTIHPEDKERVFAWFTEAQRKMESGAVEYRIISKDKTVRWVEDHVSWEKDQQGNVVSLNGVMSDITERKQAEESLTLFRSLMEQSNDAVEVVDPETARFLDANEKACAELGYTRDEFLSLKIHDIDPIVDKSAFPKVMAELRKSGSMMLESLHHRKDGTTFPVELSLKYVQLGRDYVVTIVRDITERKRAEEALLESEEKYKTLFNSAGDAIFIMNHTIFLECNIQTEKIYGCTKDQIIGHSPVEYSPEKQPDGSFSEHAAVKKIEAAFAGEPQTFEWLHTRLDGTPFYAEVSLIRVHIGEGHVLQAIVRDITERRRAEEDLQAAYGQSIIYAQELKEQIEERERTEEEKKKVEAQLYQSQKMEAIGTLAGGVAHDFNNLLTVIIGNAQLALMDVIKDKSLRKKIEEIEKAGDRAASLTRQLLAFSRKQIITPRVLDLNELLTGIEKMLGRLIGEDVELLTIPEPALWRVEVDPGQMEQVIMNMAINAKDAMPLGGKITIETANTDLDENHFRKHGIEGEKSGHYVMLAVSDTGIGMDKETQEHIFDPFFTTKEVGKGTGLGLSTVYGIVKQSNGFVWLYSEPGQGSTFKVYLPATCPPESGVGRRVASAQARRAGLPRAEGDADSEEKQQLPVIELDGSETILIVEDDNGLRKFAQEVLLLHGYKVLDAENGEDALRVSQAHEGQIHL